MKKKVLSFVMAAVLAVVLGACGGQKDPKTVYTEALDKMASLTSYDRDGSIDMTLESEGESMTLTVGVAGQVSGANTEAMQMAVTESIGRNHLYGDVRAKGKIRGIRG